MAAAVCLLLAPGTMAGNTVTLVSYDCGLIAGGLSWVAGGKVSAGLATWTKDYYLCGDADGNGVVNLTDVVYLVNYIFVDGPAPNPIEAGNVNCDNKTNITDAVYLINYVFFDGPTPCAACP